MKNQSIDLLIISFTLLSIITVVSLLVGLSVEWEKPTTTIFFSSLALSLFLGFVLCRKSNKEYSQKNRNRITENYKNHNFTNVTIH